MVEIINIHTRDGSRRTWELTKKLAYFRYAEKPIKFLFKTDKGLVMANWKFKIKYCRHNPKGAKLHMLIRNPLFQLDKHNWGFNFTVGKNEIMYNY